MEIRKSDTVFTADGHRAVHLYIVITHNIIIAWIPYMFLTNESLRLSHNAGLEEENRELSEEWFSWHYHSLFVSNDYYFVLVFHFASRPTWLIHSACSYRKLKRYLNSRLTSFNDVSSSRCQVQKIFLSIIMKFICRSWPLIFHWYHISHRLFICR